MGATRASLLLDDKRVRHGREVLGGCRFGGSSLILQYWNVCPRTSHLMQIDCQMVIETLRFRYLDSCRHHRTVGRLWIGMCLAEQRF